MAQVTSKQCQFEEKCGAAAREENARADRGYV